MKNKKILKNGSKLILSLVLLFFAVSTFAQRGGVNFSGNWSLNESGSELGEGRMRMTASNLVIKQDGNNLTIERTATRQGGGSSTSSEKYTLDGQSNVNTGAMNRQVASNVTWTDNSRTLTFRSAQKFERDGQSMEIKSTEIWSLSADGNTLTIDAVTSAQQGEWKRKLVYNKK